MPDIRYHSYLHRVYILEDVDRWITFKDEIILDSKSYN